MAMDFAHEATDAHPEMDPDAQAALRTSTGQLLRRCTSLVDKFYQRLISTDPAIASIAHGGRPMCQRTILTALESSQSAQSLASIASAVQQIGRDNYLDGLSDASLNGFAHAMLYSIRIVYAAEWSSSLSSVWVKYLMWFQDQLRIGAQAQRAQGPPRHRNVARAPADPPQDVGRQSRMVEDRYPVGAGRVDGPNQVADDQRHQEGGQKPAAAGLVTVDRIIVRDGESVKTFTVPQWKALPFVERIKYLNTNPEFYDGDQRVGAKEAILVLRR